MPLFFKDNTCFGHTWKQLLINAFVSKAIVEALHLAATGPLTAWIDVYGLDAHFPQAMPDFLGDELIRYTHPTAALCAVYARCASIQIRCRYECIQTYLIEP